MKVLQIKNIDKSFNQIEILKSFSLELNEGEIVSIIGPSGIGKSTLLRCINGLENVSRGEIIINNKKLHKKIQKEVNLDIGLVFQEYNLFPQYSALKNITLPLIYVLNYNKKEAIEKAKKLLKKMNLSKKENSYPYQLSGGEKQRLAIARTLAIDPKIICFDEPTSALDSELVKEVAKIIKKLSSEGKAILIVTHDINFSNSISDRIIEFNSISL